MLQPAVRIVQVEDVRVAMLEHRGDPRRVEASVRRFVAVAQAGAHAWREDHATYNIFYSDVRSTPPEDFRLGLCAATDKGIEPDDDGVVAVTIPGGRCAVLRHVGSDHTLSEAASLLCGEWLANSGEARRDFPLYAQRVIFFPDVPAHQAITDLFLPLR